MKLREIRCSSALSPTRLPGLDYALNPYRGCAVGCVYCYSPAVLREERPWGRFVDVKRNAPAVLAKEVKRLRPGTVGVGTVTDGYQPAEARYHITRYCLEVLARARFPVSIQTKSSLVLKDLDLLKRFGDIEVGVTITVMDEALRRRFEPFASPTARRLETLRRLNEAGVRTWAFVGPILPGATEARLEELLLGIRDSGTQRVLYDRLRYREGVWDRMVPAVDAARLTEAFGRSRSDYSADAARMEDAVASLGKDLGLRMEAAFPTGW